MRRFADAGYDRDARTPIAMHRIRDIHESLDAVDRAARRLAEATNRFTLATVLLVLAALAFEAYRFFDARDRATAAATDFRMPVANPPVEPTRPDLFEEPRIDE